MDSLERFATIRATIEQGVDRDRALRDAGLSPAEWIQLQRRWLGALAAEIAGGGDALAGRYWKAFQDALPADATTAEQPPQEAPAAPRAAEQLPSFLKPQVVIVESPATAVRPLDLRGTVLSFEAPAAPALPFRDDQPPSVAPAAETKPKPRLSTGTSLSLDIPAAPATPFAETAPPSKAPLGATVLSPEAPAASTATPFQAPEAEALGFSLMRYAELMAALGDPAADRAAVLAKFGIDEAGHARVDTYWRRKMSTSISHAANYVALLENAKKALAAPTAKPNEAPRISTGTSLSLDVSQAPATPFGTASAPPKGPPLGATVIASEAPPASAATPFQAPEAEALGFSLMRYAELVAALDDPAANRAAVLAQFGIDEAGHARIDAYWRRKMSTSISHAANFVPMLEGAKKALAARREAPKAATIGTGTALAIDRSAIPDTTSGIMRAPLPELSVDQYAWLVATLRKTAPADVPTLLTRLRLNPDTRRELEERWAKKMGADPALRETFLAALARHLGTGPR